MVATAIRDAAVEGAAEAVPRTRRQSGLWFTGIILAVLTLALTIDALIQPIAPFDLSVMNAIQSIDIPGLLPVMHAFEKLTSSEGAIGMWFAVLVAFALARKWLPALAMLMMPVGGVINEGLGAFIVKRTRPDGAEYDIARWVGEEVTAPSFPSGHVMGAVMLYGLLFFLAGRIENRLLRYAIQGGSVTVMVVTGFERIWEGAHWPSDVLAAYTLGGLLLVAIIAAYQRIETAVGHLPFIKAAYIPHDEERTHAHALTSTVFFNDDSVSKVYAPGFVPRAIYWLAFQAEFPYIRNRAALEAARERRNLAAMLTEYWFGESAVARITGIDVIHGNLALTSERVDGGEPRDRGAAKAWLKDLRERFEEAGLPTWQIDPRQPRAVDNVLETADGRYMVVDLESGLVSPLASLKTWWRAFRRGMVPIYDDVYFDVTRAYVSEHAREMRAAMGPEWFQELERTLERAHQTADAWHSSEPRLWSRLLKAAWAGFYVRSWRSRINARVAGGQQKATTWLNEAVDNWHAEGRIDAAEARQLREEISSPAVQAVLPHFGAHFVISVILRFPFGSIARVAWSAWGLGAATVKLLARRIDRHAWKQAWDVHHPIVIALAAIPGFGAFAYLATRPVRANRLLMRVTIDAVMKKIPKGLYEKSGLRKWIARPQLQPAYVPARRPAGPRVPRYTPSLRTQAVAYRATRTGAELSDLAAPVPQASHRGTEFPERAPPYA
ncbi:MAG TPA: phosphatase PAP2 family protein [Thermomicrobiales bacterium]|nr:phosphatase PAP2 family protein [Thermomicrobiales bacterium]